MMIGVVAFIPRIMFRPVQFVTLERPSRLRCDFLSALTAFEQ